VALAGYDYDNLPHTLLQADTITQVVERNENTCHGSATRQNSTALSVMESMPARTMCSG
jgi:hypothetical protein